MEPQYFLQAAKGSSGESGGLLSLLNRDGQLPALKKRRWWMRDGEGNNLIQTRLPQELPAQAVCIKCLHGIFLHLKTGHFSCRWGAFLPLYSSHLEADFFMAVKWKPHLGSVVSTFPYQKQIFLLPELSESSWSGWSSGSAGLGISRQSIQNIFLFILCNTRVG